MSLFKDYGYATWEDAFNAALDSLQISRPAEIIADGKIHRFSVNGKRGNTSGYYVIYQDELIAGHIGDWSTGDKINWHWSKTTLTDTQKLNLADKWDKARKQAKVEQLAVQAETAKLAQQKAQELATAPDSHPYLVKKGIRAHGIKIGQERLYIPLYNEQQQIVSFQSIDDNGVKLYAKGGQVKGCYYLIGSPQDRLFIAEGFATAASIYEATGVATACTFDAGNMEAATENLAKLYPQATITICADNDANKTINKGLLTAQSIITKHGYKLAYPEFTEQELAKDPAPSDFNDLAQLRGKGAISLALFPPVPAEQTNLKFKALTIEQIQTLPPVNWLIDKIFPLNSFCIIYGEPAQKKTFLALDMALSIAANQEWHERSVEAGSVLYIAGEGVGGLNKRISAWMQHYQLSASEIEFLTVPMAVNFIDEADINQLIALIDHTGRQYKAIFIDTVARALLGGDENSSTDIGKFVAGCDAVRNHTKATVIGIHHSGKDDSRGMRGSSALMGAVDTVLKVEQDENTKIVTVTMKKQKDEEEITPLTFKSTLVEFGIAQSSIVLEMIEAPENEGLKVNNSGNSGKLKRHDLALEYLQDCIANSSEKLFGMPATQLNQWKLECSARDLGGDSQDAKRMAFARAYNRLLETKQIASKNGLVSIVRKNEG